MSGCFVKRERPILFSVNCELAFLFSVESDLDPLFTTRLRFDPGYSVGAHISLPARYCVLAAREKILTRASWV